MEHGLLMLEGSGSTASATPGIRSGRRRHLDGALLPAVVRRHGRRPRDVPLSTRTPTATPGGSGAPRRVDAERLAGEIGAAGQVLRQRRPAVTRVLFTEADRPRARLADGRAVRPPASALREDAARQRLRPLGGRGPGAARRWPRAPTSTPSPTPGATTAPWACSAASRRSAPCAAAGVRPRRLDRADQSSPPKSPRASGWAASAAGCSRGSRPRAAGAAARRRRDDARRGARGGAASPVTWRRSALPPRGLRGVRGAAHRAGPAAGGSRGPDRRRDGHRRPGHACGSSCRGRGRPRRGGADARPARRPAVAAAEVVLAVDRGRAASSPRHGGDGRPVRVDPGAVNSIPAARAPGDRRARRRRSPGATRCSGACAPPPARPPRRAGSATPTNAQRRPAGDLGPALIDAIEEAAAEAGLASTRMVSRAYHDCVCSWRGLPDRDDLRPLPGGVSHRPDEYTSALQIAQGAQVLAGALRRLAA